MRAHLWHLCGIAAATMATACGPRVPIKAGPDPVTAQAIAARYQNLIDEGCYLCLRDVVRQYHALDAGMKEAPPVQDAAVKAALLFMMRGKELSIPVDDDWREAEALVDARGAESGDYALYAAIARSFPWNAIGAGEDFVDSQFGVEPYPAQRLQDDWRSDLDAMWKDSEVAAYVDVSLNCEFRPQKPIDMTPIKTRYASVPLIQYRWATCGGLDASKTLEAIIGADSRFFEARYVLAIRQASARQYDEAQENDLEAWQGIPNFTAAAVSYGNLALTAEAFDEATRAYDAVLAIVPTHRRALLGKVEALTYQAQYQAAADGARHMIALGHWLIGDGYYWLSLNEYRMEQIDQGLEDVETAKRFESGARDYFLAGLLRMKQQDWTNAKREFVSTIAADPDYCDAMLNLGQMNVELKVWPEASGAFVDASACYVKARNSLGREIAQLSRQTGARAARQLARRQAELKDTIDKQGASLYAAGVSYMNLGNRDQALTYATQAEGFDAYAEKAKTLIARLQRLGSR